MRGETRRKARRRIRRRSIAARIAVKTTGAAAQGAGERPSPRAPRRTPEGAMRGLLRRRQRSGTRENETSRAGLRPEDIYVYGERSQGRANRPFLAVSPEREARVREADALAGVRAPLRRSKPHTGRQISTEAAHSSHYRTATKNTQKNSQERRPKICENRRIFSPRRGRKNGIIFPSKKDAKNG